ncbi:MAG: hypothetical protein HW416_1241 [Chloroflexi bacterium]|nr:hypothetical protein [Chloroflexota bacterium]
MAERTLRTEDILLLSHRSGRGWVRALERMPLALLSQQRRAERDLVLTGGKRDDFVAE